MVGLRKTFIVLFLERLATFYNCNSNNNTFQLLIDRNLQIDHKEQAYSSLLAIVIID